VIEPSLPPSRLGPSPTTARLCPRDTLAHAQNCVYIYCPL
jgi:hypothetical protein